MSKLKGRIAIVTGASRRQGIGTAICLRLASDGADIFFTHWQQYDDTMPWGADLDWPSRLCQEVRSMGVRCEGMPLDLSQTDAPYQLLNAVEEKLGQPSILVNNASHSTRGGYMSLDADSLDAHYAVNVRATCLLSVEFARRFQENKQNTGSIINMVSGQEQGPMLGQLAYVATKGAISAFTRSLSAEVAPLGITVNAVNPGPTDSGWMTEELKERLRPKFLMGRIGQPVDAARIVAFLASDDAQWVTGQILHSEGGYLRS